MSVQTVMARRLWRQRYLAWMSAMADAAETMPADDRMRLQRWEEEFVDGSGDFASSEWPGWSRYVGPPPERPTR